MAHEDEPTTGQKIWGGKYDGPDGAFAEAYDAYQASPQLNPDRVIWTSALYSEFTRRMIEAKHLNPNSFRLLVRNGVLLYPQMRHFQRLQAHEDMTPSACEPIARILYRWSKVPLFGGMKYVESSITYARLAYDSPWEPGDHVHAQAALTLAAILKGRRAFEYLQVAIDIAPMISDPNQRSRAYRGAAVLFLTLYHDVPQAMGLIEKAIEIPELGEDVIFKNAEAYQQIKNAE